MVFTGKKRMLNAYKGIYSDHYPVAPEFWFYYPAKVLGVDMVELQREIPHWKALQACFGKFGTEGWGNADIDILNEEVKSTSEFKKLSDGTYRLEQKRLFRGQEFISSMLYDKKEPCWMEQYPVKEPGELKAYIDMTLSERNSFSFDAANAAYESVGGDYLLELPVGSTFFDFIAWAMSFKEAVMYLVSEEEEVLEDYRRIYTEHCLRLVDEAVRHTPFEAYFIGCAYSCNSLLGPRLWRRWDKPFIKAIAQRLHQHGKLLHIHFHGNSMETVEDFAEIGIDCVCPFERPSGGDVKGLEGLAEVRKKLDGRVTMNGNVHTVETLIRGTEKDVRREVQEIKEAFKGSPRLVIGTGDQVGLETPEENILAMVEEARKA